MREIELKAVLCDRVEVVRKLEAMGCVWSEPVRQEDAIFFPPGLHPPTPIGTNVLRLRKQDGKTLFTFKRSVGEHSDKLEAETEVGDYAAMERIIAYLGYDTVIRVNKVRTKTRLDQTEVCLDEVEGLGTFIEVERMIADDGDGEVVSTELEALLVALGIAKEDHVFTRGYDVLLYERGLARQLPVQDGT